MMKTLDIKIMAPILQSIDRFGSESIEKLVTSIDSCDGEIYDILKNAKKVTDKDLHSAICTLLGYFVQHNIKGVNVDIDLYSETVKNYFKKEDNNG